MCIQLITNLLWQVTLISKILNTLPNTYCSPKYRLSNLVTITQFKVIKLDFNRERAINY